MIKVKRIYDSSAKEDGFRILVDRLWPRGISKDEAKVDLWLRDIAPSDELRKWFAHDPRKWEEFKEKIRKRNGKQWRTALCLTKSNKQKKKKELLPFSIQQTMTNTITRLL